MQILLRNQLFGSPHDLLTPFGEGLKFGTLKDQEPPLLSPYVKSVFVVARDLKPSNFKWPGNLLSFGNINGQLVKWLLKQL